MLSGEEISAKKPENVLLITCLSKNLTTRIEVLHHSLQIISERENIGSMRWLLKTSLGHIDQIKQTNAGAVYRLIDQLGPVSRIDLSRLAQLAPASITKIVREMLEAHCARAGNQRSGNRGRPAVGLVVETEAWHYLSLRISRGEIFLALRDLSSNWWWKSRRNWR